MKLIVKVVLFLLVSTSYADTDIFDLRPKPVGGVNISLYLGPSISIGMFPWKNGPYIGVDATIRIDYIYWVGGN